MKISKTLTISIASKDRPEVVEATLRKIHAFGLGDCPLVLCDDGSLPPLAPAALALFPRGRLIRNENAQGQALARNRIAEECATPYLLQLDDDSYPVEGSLEVLLDFAARQKDWLAIAIPFEEPARGRAFPKRIPEDRAIQVKSFVGCSALFDVGRFRQLGGYADWIQRTVEEEELCIRGVASGAHVFAIDQLRIRHEVSERNRNDGGIIFRAYRNWSLVWFLHAPICCVPWRLLRLMGGAGICLVRNRKLFAIKGCLQGCQDFFRLRERREALTFSDYSRWRRLPHMLDFFGDEIVNEK